ncbi:MAG TPA: S8 family serine peptidase [Verrucomicrobiae bacterium]|nr:S8 family serine peptidase [Verrucomicrobiae bacterium]
MQYRSRCWIYVATLALVLFSFKTRAETGPVLNWNTNQNQVSADIQSLPVARLLGAIARHTGWQVFLEPNLTHNVSTKFQNLPLGQALHMLLGNLNFALVPQTNGPTHLYVFHTSMGKATQMIRPGDLLSKVSRSGPIPNELVVTVKPGVNIDGLDCLQDASVTGKIEKLNTYRVQFKDEAAAKAARDCLAGNPNVLAVESNFSLEQPDLPVGVGNASPQFNLSPKANNGDCQVVIGLIDTSVGALGNNLDQFMLKSISVAGQPNPDSQLTHGTAMADTILRGVQANTGGTTSIKVLPVDVYGPNETTSTFDVATGVYEAVQAGANVINMSLGGQGDSAFLHTLIQNASKQGVVFFAAAGNQPVTTPTYPAAYPEVEAVTAGNGPGQVADYANRGSFVDLMLPGTSIVPFDGQSWAVTGTSTATAYASGIAAGLADSSHNCPGSVIPQVQSKFGVSLGGLQ